MYACEGGNEAIIQFLIEKGCNLTDKDISGNNAFHYIVQSNVSQNKPEIMELLMNTNKFDLNHQNKEGETVLHMAIKFNNLQLFNYLIYHYGATININILTCKNYSPLIYACIYGHLKIVKALVIRRHCDINIKGSNGKSALAISIEKGYLDIAEYLITNFRNEIVIDLFYSNKNSILSYACQYGHQKLVELIVEMYSKELLNTPGNQGKTPLIIASENGHYEIVKYLLQKGALIDITSNDGNGPLICAVKGNYLEIANLLLSSDPKIINKSNLKGQTALTIASQNANLDMIEKLILYKANINHKDEKNRTPLMYVCYSKNSNLDIIYYFIKNGANINDKCDVNAFGNYGQTAYEIAYNNKNFSGKFDDKIKLKKLLSNIYMKYIYVDKPSKTSNAVKKNENNTKKKNGNFLHMKSTINYYCDYTDYLDSLND